MLDNLIQSLANEEVEDIPQSPIFKAIMDLPIAPPKRGGKSKDGRVI